MRAEDVSGARHGPARFARGRQLFRRSHVWLRPFHSFFRPRNLALMSLQQSFVHA